MQGMQVGAEQQRQVGMAEAVDHPGGVQPGMGEVLVAEADGALAGQRRIVDHPLGAAAGQQVGGLERRTLDGGQADAARLGAFADGGLEGGFARLLMALGEAPLAVLAGLEQEPTAAAHIMTAQQQSGGTDRGAGRDRITGGQDHAGAYIRGSGYAWGFRRWLGTMNRSRGISTRKGSWL